MTHVLYRKAKNASRRLSAFVRRNWRYLLYKCGKNDLSFIEKYNIVQARYIPLVKKNGKPSSGDSIADFYFSQEISDHIILMVGLGKNVRGNLQYILNELNHSEKYKKFKIYVRTSAETDPIVTEYIRQNNWTQTHTVPGEREYRRLLESAKYMITEVYFPEGWFKKPEQVYINIWHGTPLKKLGLAKNARNHHGSGVVQKNFIDADYLLYPNEYTRENMLASYKVAQLMTGKTFLSGYPRTGGMLAESRSDSEETRRLLAPNGEKIYAFMPTFRDYLKGDAAVAQAREFLDYMDANLRPDQLLYVNLHHRLNDSIDYSVYSRVKKFPPTVDSYRLLCASEALISDYSSVFIDYLALRKQIVLYVPDFDVYSKKRGMYIDLYSFPFDKARTPEEVIDALNRGKQYDDASVFEEFCSHDSARNAELLCQLVLGASDGLTLEDIPKNTKKRTLVFSRSMQTGYETEFLHSYTQWYDRETREIYLSCDKEQTDHNRDAAYPMLRENPVIGIFNNSQPTTLGRSVKELYLEGKIDFAKAIECLCYDYVLMLTRFYGRAVFDSVVIYDVDDPEILLALSQSRAPKTLFLPRHVIDSILGGDRFLRDAVCYTAASCRNICVLHAEDREAAGQILGNKAGHKIQLVETPQQMDAVL